MLKRYAWKETLADPLTVNVGFDINWTARNYITGHAFWGLCWRLHAGSWQGALIEWTSGGYVTSNENDARGLPPNVDGHLFWASYGPPDSIFQIHLPHSAPLPAYETLPLAPGNPIDSDGSWRKLYLNLGSDWSSNGDLYYAFGDDHVLAHFWAPPKWIIAGGALEESVKIPTKREPSVRVPGVQKSMNPSGTPVKASV